jgi:hypothetical protein
MHRLTLSLAICTVYSLLIPELVADQKAAAPVKFAAEISNWGDATYTVELRDGAVYYHDSEAGPVEPLRVVPTDKQWAEFRATLEANNVWKWRSLYEPDQIITDGTSWFLSITFPDHSIAIRGFNCYPEADGRPGPAVRRTATFINFEKAVQRLIGGKPFAAAD